MASSAIPAPGTGARIPRSTSIDLRTGREPAAGLVLALALLVLLGMTWVDVARLSHEQAQVDRTYRVLRGLDAVLTSLTEARTGGHGLLVPGQDDRLAPAAAGQDAIAGEIDALAALTADSPVQQRRIRQLRLLVHRDATEVRSAVGLRRSRGLQAVGAVVRQPEDVSRADRLRELTAAVRAEEERLLDARRADASAATQATRGTLVVAGLVGLLLAAGAATGVGRSGSGSPHRPVPVPQGPADDRPDRRRPPTAEEAGAGRRGSDGLAAVTTSIAQQTELLALDATIEAARVAGAGSGIGGVADEVEAFVREAAETTGDVARPVRTDPSGTAAGSPVATLTRATVHAAARSRAHGPTTALWHAVELHRPIGELDGPCELAVCGSLVRISTEQRWPVAARDVCPACATLAR